MYYYIFQQGVQGLKAFAFCIRLLLVAVNDEHTIVNFSLIVNVGSQESVVVKYIEGVYTNFF